MRRPLRLLTKQNFQLKLRLEILSLGLTLKVCIVFSITSSSLACWGGGGYYGDGGEDAILFNFTKVNATLPVPDMDEKFVLNLTGISDPVEKIIKSAWLGWEPDEETKKDWKKWYEEFQACKEKYEGSDGKRKKKGKVKIPAPADCTKYGFAPAGSGAGGWGRPGGGGAPGGPGGSGSDYSYDDHRGPGSGWPDSPGWKDLGAGSGGAPIPPWAYRPINIGKPAFCYLSPIRGKCKSKLTRWGYNPYIDQCQSYIYGGCGGTRNRFTTQEICEKHCMQPIEPSCSVDSGIIQTVFDLPDK